MHVVNGGGTQVGTRQVDLGRICIQAISALQPVYPNETIQCEIHGDQKGHWDAKRLLQIFSNVIANALEHGKTTSGVLVKLDGQRQEVVRLQVHYKGILSASLLSSLFDPFDPARRRPEHSYGVGLGLFIVKEIVSAHGGSIDIASEEGRTTFTVLLPRAAPHTMSHT